MKKFAIVSKNDFGSIKIATSIKNKLIDGGMEYSETSPEIICVIGGDGTFLSAIHKYMDKLDSVLFTGVHTGTLGFFADYRLVEMDKCVEDILTKQPEVEEKNLLAIELDNGKKFNAVNEMWVQSIKTKTINVYVNDELLETFHGGGLLVSTQAGSTAFNRSLNGAIMCPGINLLELCEISGIHHNRFHSVGNAMLFNEKTVITLASNDYSNTKMCFDRYDVDIEKCKSVKCYLSDKKLRLAHYDKNDWIQHLKQLF